MKYTKTNVFQKGFTLIELLVVIAILGILVVGLMVAIDPADKIAAANDSRVITDIGAVARAAEAYTTVNSAKFPPQASFLTDLVAAGELKIAPTFQGRTATILTLPATPCTAATCVSFTITAPLLSKKYVPSTPFAKYESLTGKQCTVLTAATACP